MKKFQIITDSCIDLDLKTIEALKIDVVSLSYNLKGKDHKNYSMMFNDFYEEMRAGNVVSTTQVNPFVIEECAKQYLDQGEDVLFISFSSQLSGTYNSFYKASISLQDQYPSQKIYLVDSLCACTGQGLLVKLACNQRDEGKSILEVYKYVEEIKGRVCHVFTVESLEYLRRGGRISTIKAVVGQLLKLKPVLHMSKEGKLVPLEKCRGRRASLIKIAEIVEKTIENPEEQIIYISHADSINDCIDLKNLLNEKIKIKDILIEWIGPVIGSHAGPGTISVFYLGNERLEK